ncbi:4'-phosphopantetheinyl transferase family protein [Streptomyces griseorubiginosus]|uniref:4'-phosphopantetheinyl transferase family protein n=1 Tax=Streptomyces griseorubiginosus TaxID=67304 RepID=UPI001AD6DBD5|nr:4'-phosphopantetheinyl transferase superfamily protein [Streptomyces griseorubiginosus]MBO4256143.1 4'-phosphopantetheinyl transferase superfamily protein [Streptomyces griseorubiginosus]
MIEELLPEPVVAVEAFGDEEARGAALYPEEEQLVARAVDKRRREFTSVRVCARRAMEKLGVPPGPVLSGECGAPVWPDGLTGTMTHCDGYRAAALARTPDLASLGIDAEPHGQLPDGVFESIALPTEQHRHRGLRAARPTVHWDRLLFSAKESVYKAWFPLTHARLNFSESDVEFFTEPGHGGRGRFHARLLAPGPKVDGVRLSAFEGRWLVGKGLMLTVVTVPHH